MAGASERMEPIRLGYVGCGFMAQAVHLPNFSTLAGCRLVALAEVRPGLARAVAERFRIERIYSSHLELAQDPDIEAVGVSAGFALQGEIAADLLRAGKHVFMEKPMAVSVAQAERLLEAARQGGARLMVGYMKRHDPGNVLARETIARWQAEGESGDVLYARNHGFCGNWLSRLDRGSLISTDEPMPQASADEFLPDWLPEQHRSGYVGYLQQYTHNVNLLRYMLGVGDEVSVRGTDLDADGMTGLVTFDMGGVRAVVETGGSAYHDWDEHTQVYFQRGWVHAWSPPLMARESQASVEVYRGGEGASFTHPVPPAGWSYRVEAEAFLRCLRSGEEFRSSGQDTLTDVRLFEEVYRRHLGL